jgi:hypothetical protein
MAGTYRTPRAYTYRGHTIEPLPSRVCGPEGWCYWLVCPDSGVPSWQARSLADAREGIELAVLAAGEVG